MLTLFLIIYAIIAVFFGALFGRHTKYNESLVVATIGALLWPVIIVIGIFIDVFSYIRKR